MHILWITWMALNFLPQAADMYIDSSCIPRIIIAPDKIQKLLSAVHFILIQRKQFQHIKFFCSQIDFPLSNKDTAALAI